MKNYFLMDLLAGGHWILPMRNNTYFSLTPNSEPMLGTFL